MNKDWFVEPLSTKKHEREHFKCGVNILDDYLKKFASKELKRRVNKVFVLLDREEPCSILGYYTLSASSFDKKSLPEKTAKKLPHYPVPAVILGCLAVHQKLQGQGAGKILLVNAFYRVLVASSAMGVYAVIVDAKNEEVKKFYESYGFIPFEDQGFRLFIPLETLESLYK